MPIPSEFLLCPVCAKPDRVSLSPAWQKKVAAGYPIDIVGCGNPWHYQMGDDHIDIPHRLSGQCWCRPSVEYVPPKDEP